jgi:hypothetical protein
MIGLLYDSLAETSKSNLYTRINWIKSQTSSTFSPQPYEQFSFYLNKVGRDDDAKKIQIEKNRDPLLISQKDFFSRQLHRAFGLILGYGYKPSNALVLIILFIIAGWIIFWQADNAGILTSLHTSNSPKFNSLIYSADNFIPLIDLQMAKYWNPSKDGNELIKFRHFNISCGSLIRFYLWAHIVVGWILVTFFVVGLTGLVKK